MDDLRVNARIDEATQRQLDDIVEATGATVSQVVRESIGRYHAQLKQQRQRPPSKFLALAGLGNSGCSDISSNVKHYVGEALEAKLAAMRGAKPSPQKR